MSSNQNQQSQTPERSDIIARADAKGKILDFRNALVPANPEHYAMMQGIGGSDYAALSTIMVAITDYSKGKGENSRFVKAHVLPEVLEMVRHVCIKNLGEPVVPMQQGDWGRVVTMIQKVDGIFSGVGNTVSTVSEGLTEAEPGKTIAEKLKKVLAKIIAPKEPIVLHKAPVSVDYHYRQERVNIYSKDYNEGGYVNVSTLEFTRNGYVPEDVRNKDGEVIMKKGDVKKLPWTVRISNFKALPKKQENGTVSYVSSSVKEKQDVFISLSDEAMFSCCYRVDRFVTVWETMISGPFIRAGAEKKEVARIEAAARRKGMS